MPDDAIVTKLYIWEFFKALNILSNGCEVKYSTTSFSQVTSICDDRNLPCLTTIGRWYRDGKGMTTENLMLLP